VKLPAWFTVPTPVGDYNPDWAVLLEEEGEETLYFVAETKGIEKVGAHLTRDEIKDQVRPEEWRKIRCGAAHFGSEQLDKEGALDDVDYRVVSEADELP
jgi:type III restriction enzyme